MLNPVNKAICRTFLCALAFTSFAGAQIVERSRTLADLLQSHPCNSGLAGRHTIVTDCDAADDLGNGGGAFSCFARCDGVDTWAAASIGGGSSVDTSAFVLLAGDADGQVIQGVAGAHMPRINISSTELNLYGDGAGPAPLSIEDGGIWLTSQDQGSHVAVYDGAAEIVSDGSLKLSGLTVNINSTQTPPTNANDTCTAGDTIDTATFHYYCHTTDTWVRVAMATWP